MEANKHNMALVIVVLFAVVLLKSEMIFSVFSGADQILLPINLLCISVYLVGQIMCFSH